MNDKLLSIKEFEFITSNNSYAETGDNIHYLSERYFKELDDFIRNQESTDDEGNPLDFLRARTVKGIGNVIQAKNFVGLIQLESGCQIQILPKVDFGTNDTGKTTEEVFIDMLKTMKDFPGKVFSSANLRTESVNLYEIFINMYLYQLSLLTRKGLKSAYISQEDTLNVFKGKLLVNRHLKENIGHAERFSLAYDEFNLNRPENRLIKSTLLKLQKISTSSNNLKSIRQQLIYFDLVAPSWNYASDFDEVQIDRTTKDYEEILAWSKVFLM
ncbi:McrC family protein, partial [Granulicatella adiacens]